MYSGELQKAQSRQKIPLQKQRDLCLQDRECIKDREPSPVSHLIFEYVMPANRPRGEEPDLNDIMRPDLIILSSDTVGIFEFKQRDNDDRYTIKPAKKYRKSIRRYHCNSIGMRKKAALVLTTRNGYISRHNRLVSCSPDMLPQIMDEYFKEHNTLHPSPEAWMKSEFGLR